MHTATLLPVTAERIDAFVELCRELMSLSSYQQPFDAAWTKRNAQGGMVNPAFFGRMAQLQDGSYCGFIVGSVAPFLFSPKMIGVEETIYVKEKTPYRAAIAAALMREMEAWMFDEKKVEFIRVGETSDINPVAADAFFRRQGYKLAGTLYKKDRS